MYFPETEESPSTPPKFAATEATARARADHIAEARMVLLYLFVADKRGGA